MKKIVKNKNLLNTIICILLIIASVLIIALRSEILCSDALWHLKNGEWIVNNGLTNTLPYTIHDNLPFMAHEWLFDIVAYGIDTLLGYRGIVIISVMLYVLGFGIMTFYKKENRLEKAFLVFLFGFLGFSKILMFIPDTIGVVLIISSNFIWLSNLDIKKKTIANIVFTILIANLHGATLTAYITQLCLYVFVDGMYYIFKKEKADVKSHLILIGTALASGLINPYGIKTYAYSFYMLGADFANYMVDWQPYSFRGIGPIIVFVFCMVFMFAGNKNLKELRKEDVIRYGIICLWLMMTFKYQRCINLLCYSLVAFGGDWIAFGLKSVCKLFKKKWLSLSVLSVLVIALFTSFIDKHNYSTTSEYVGQTISKEAVDYLKADGKTVFNYLNLSGYLMYENVDVFIDGRTDPYMKSFNKTEDITHEHLKACYYPDCMKELTNKYGFTDIILENNTVISELYKQAGFKEVYSDEKVIIFANKYKK